MDPWSFNPLLPLAFVWFLIDVGFFRAATIFAHDIGGTERLSLFLIPFFLIHMMPVWIYLAGILFVFRRYKHTEYIVTDKGVYVSGGLVSYTCQMKPFAEISHINIHRGIFDQQLNVGDVVFSWVNDETAPNIRVNGRQISMGLSISDIPDYQKVFELVKKLQIDIFTDTMYPNDLRPPENHGYRTKYKGL